MKQTLAAFALVVSLTACGAESRPRNDVIVGAMVPRTGNNANADWIVAGELAVDEMNQALDRSDNRNGLRIQWESRDTASTPALMRQYARELVGLGAKILTGEASASAHGNAENYVTETAPLGTPIICASCTSGDINKPSYTNKDPLVEAAFRDPGNWLFRTAPNNQNHNAIITSKMATLGEGGDTNGDGFVKVVVICTTDTGCISTQSPSDVQASRKASIDTLSVALGGGTCQAACSTLPGANSAAECPATCAAAPGCNFNPTIASCVSDRIVYEYLLIDQYTARNAAAWADLMVRVFDNVSDYDTFTLAPGTTSESADKPGTVSSQARKEDPAGCKGPDIIWNKSLPIPSLSLVGAYATGGYRTSHPTTKFMSHDPFHRNFIRQELGDAGNGQEGIAFQPWDRSPSGEYFVAAQKTRTGNAPTSFEAQYYDAQVLAMLATIKAAITLPDPRSVTGAEVRDALFAINDPAGTPVGTGPEEFAKGIALLEAGKPINYVGASGACDFTTPSATDGGGNVGAGEAVYWRIENSQFSYKEIYDCRQSATNCQLRVITP